ncbi:hypothetical protein GOBAR_DD24248 [Gossypium barbadense]|nr:hypothetical protein GOBAR_DD24248 [Gossypium barbadense]
MAGGGGVFVFDITHNDAGEVALAVYKLIEMKLFCSATRSSAVFFEPNLHRLAFGKRESARKMSGPGKKVVDVAFKASKNIDWEGMAKLLVSDEARKEFATLRRTFDEVNSTLQTKFSQEPEPIDWEYYRKGIGSRLVDMYKEAYERFQRALNLNTPPAVPFKVLLFLKNNVFQG